MRKTYSIEVKFHFEGEQDLKPLEEVCRRAARSILVQASLLSQGRKPQVVIMSEDVYEGRAFINMEDEPTDE